MEENRRDVVEALRAAGVPVWVTFPRTVAEGIGLIRELGALTGTEAAADAMAGPSRRRATTVLARAARGPAVRVFCPIWRGPYMTVNRDTYVHDMLRTCGGDNVFGDSADSLSDGHPRRRARRGARRDPACRTSPTGSARRTGRTSRRSRTCRPCGQGRIRLVDGKLLSWYGPRIAEAFERLPALLSPDA